MGRLDANNPDRVLPYCGIGSVCYDLMEYEWAARCFLYVRQYREKTMGGDTVDCATIYNNLGCCFFKMRRYSIRILISNYLYRFIESNAYFKLAEAIF